MQRPTHRDPRGDPRRDHGEWGLLHWPQAYPTVGDPRGDHGGDHSLNEQYSFRPIR